MSETPSDRPEITVVIPCKDEGALLEEAVRSVLDQEVAVGVEVVVVDDDSTDPTTHRIQSELAGRPGVRVLENERTPGVSGARNTGIARGRGDWIAFLDADDVLLPRSLARRWDVTVADPDARFVAGDFLERRPDGERVGWTQRFDDVPRSGDAIRRIDRARGRRPYVRFRRPASLVAEIDLVWTGTVFVEKALVESVGGFDERYGAGEAEDTHLWIRLGAEVDLHFVPDYLACYRRRPNSVTRSADLPQLGAREAFRDLLTDDLREHRTALKHRLARMNNRLMWRYRARGRSGPALRAALRAVRYAPLRWGYWRNLFGALAGRD